MNTTTNYNLPQWEDSDRVTRESVNGAMAAVDAALAANAPRLVKLYDTVTSEDLLMQIDIPYAALSPENYLALILVFERPFGAASGGTTTRLYVDGETTGYRSNESSTETYRLGTECDGGILFLRTDPIDNKLRCISAVGSGGNLTWHRYYYDTRTADKIANLCFIATGLSSRYPIGSRVRVYGVKG